MITLAELIEIAKNYGTGAIVTMFLLGLIYLFIVRVLDYSFFKKKADYTNKKNKNSSENFNKLVHDILISEFFRNLKFKISIDIPTDTFSKDLALDMLSKDLLTVLFVNIEKSIISTIEKMTPEQDDWVNMFLEAIYDAIEGFDRDVKAEAIPAQAIDEFKIWLAPFLQQIYNYINAIETNGNGDVLKKTRFFFLMLELVLINAMAQIQAFEIFSENLNGLEYKGQVVGSHNSTE